VSDNHLFQRIQAKLTNFLSEEAPETGSKPVRQRDSHQEPDEAPAPAAAVDTGSFEAHLQSLLGSGAQALAGRVNFIGLNKIKEKLGAQWPHVADRADDITRRAIERRLTPADVFTRYQELQYLIIFAQLSKEQAQLKCALIAEEITKRLLGENISSDLLEVKTMVSAVGGHMQFEDVLSIGALAAKFVAEAGGNVAGQAASIPSPANGGVSTTSSVGANSGGNVAAMESGGAAPVWSQFQSDGSKSAGHSKIDTPAQWELGEASDPLATLNIMYRPTWATTRNAVTGFHCVLTTTGLDGRPTLWTYDSAQSPDGSLAQRLDLLVLRQTVTHLRTAVGAGHKLLLIIPVHFETLAPNARRVDYIGRCRLGIPPELARYVVFEIQSVPDGVPQSRLLEITSALRPYCTGISTDASPGQSVFRPTSETGITCIGYEHRGMPGSESREIQEMQRVVAGAQKAGMIVCVRCAHSVSFAVAAIAAGTTFLSGNVVSLLTERPGPVYKFALADLYAASARASRLKVAS
jgi:hypothetical protein